MYKRASRISMNIPLGNNILPTLSYSRGPDPSLDQKIFYNRNWAWPPGWPHEASCALCTELVLSKNWFRGFELWP